MTRGMTAALTLLEGHEYGVVTSGATALIDNQPWIHWRTANALADRGLAVVTQADVGEWEIRLPNEAEERLAEPEAE